LWIEQTSEVSSSYLILEINLAGPTGFCFQGWDISEPRLESFIVCIKSSINFFALTN
jgi:hypothetical protein